MPDSTIFFTGATSGFGKIAACKLANEGALVVATTRSIERGKALQGYYKKTYPNGSGSIELIECDLMSLESTANACREFKNQFGRLDSLILNAGVMNSKFNETPDGIEETLQVNLLAPILMTHLLADLLEKSNAAKIIITSSGLHKGDIQFDDLEFRNKYTGFKCYAQSKLGVILFSRLMAKRLASKNIGIYTQHPGVVKTNLGRDFDWFSKMIFSLMGRSPEKGAETLLFLAKADKATLESGAYYAKKKVTKTTPQSYDLETAEKLISAAQTYLKNYISQPSGIFL